MGTAALTFGSTFTGIGGMDLGLERAGMKCRWQIENSQPRQRVLEKCWPNVKRYGDITEVDGAELEGVDCIAGGFPCQDVSLCGFRAGIDGKRSGLWGQMLRVVRRVRPRYVIVENVSGLLVSDDGQPAAIARVLGDLAESGFDAEWDCLPASAFGFFHERERVFIVAYVPVRHRNARRLLEACGSWRAQLQSRRLHSMAVAQRGQQENIRLESEPRLARLVHGIPNRTHRLEGLGNAVVPDVAEFIGKLLVAFHQETFDCGFQCAQPQ